MNASPLRVRADISRFCFACGCLLSCFAARLQAAPLFADSGFVLETVATLPANEPVGMAWGPDGAMYVWQENGIVRVMKDGVLLPDPFIDLRGKVNIVNDRGLNGFALDPDFSANGYAYLLYTYEENGAPSNPGPKTSRLTRVTASPENRHVSVPGSEVVLLGKTGVPPCSGYPAGSDCIGSDSHSHGVGTLRFGKDGKLLVSMGDGAMYDMPDTNALRSQDLNRYEGKILRINKDGSAPGDNPFDDGTNSIRSKVYSYGLRNPYRFGIEPVSGDLYIGDVGWNTREEVNTGKGANFGWPCYEGKDPQPRYQERFAQCRQLEKDSVTFAVHEYGGPDGHSSIGGAFLSSSAYPDKYKDSYFFADYSNAIIRRMTFGSDRKVTSVSPFLKDAEGPVSIELGPDGWLYYISLSAGEVRRIGLFAGDPVAKASTSPNSGPSPLQVGFSSAGTLDPGGLALTYHWDFGDGNTSTAPNPSHTYSITATETFIVRLTVSNTEAKTAFDTLTVTVGSTRPKAVITAPLPGTTVSAGDSLQFRGTASDDDETLGPESMAWSVILRHNDHDHPYSTNTGSGGSFVSEAHGEGVYSYEIVLTVTDNSGLQDTQIVSVAVADQGNGIAPAAARIALADGAPFSLALVDTRGRTVFRSEGRGGNAGGGTLKARIAEARARRQPRQVYALRISSPSLRTPLVLFLGPDL